MKINQAISTLKEGGLAVLPTDTIYGIHCLALDKKAVENIYRIRKRDLHKPCIILISDIREIELFGIGLFERTEKFLKKIWPGKASIIIPSSRKKQSQFEYLHRGVGSLAFRMPDHPPALLKILGQTGPLVSTSANLQGMPPAKNIRQAKEYFGKQADFYLDGGELDSVPSTLARIEQGKLEILRKGEVDLESIDF